MNLEEEEEPYTTPESEKLKYDDLDIYNIFEEILWLYHMLI